MSTIATTTAQTESTAGETARQLARLRHQRDVLLLAVGAFFAIVALLVVRIAPSWTDPLDAGLTAFGAYAGVVVPYLLRRR
ncbi:hypothetical protein [Streptomyces sp. H27-H5]|uniref:hypothetical protein n=1 Tax=Streptomyces sp. H27-H5 TaxID=2996460 RepID=UPI00226F2DD9|nr:hypothetical protein [Streptomyces sp. H27-H5]MCY0963361.1 hypothetical protein [Streptomyces sp. H27-H5]